MTTILRHINRSYSSQAEAEAAAEILRANDDDGWIYEVDVSSTGRAVIRVRDEDGELVETF